MNAPCRPDSSRFLLTASLVVLIALMLGALGACAPIRANNPAQMAEPLPVYPGPPDEPRFAYERTIFSSADVVPDKKDDAFRRYVTGEARTGVFLGKPYAAAVHRGRVYVTDTAERHVKVFDLAEGRYFAIGEEGVGELAKPLGLDVDQSGQIYVADASAKAIMIYDRDGRFLRKIGGKDLFDRLSSVTVNRAGTRVYVVDIGGVDSENHRVRVFDPTSGRHLMDIGTRGDGPGQFNLPRDLAIGKDGRLYVVDGGNFRVQVFNADGSYRESFGSVGRQLGSFARPKEIATDPDGNVYVVDAAFGNFQIFTADGELLMFIGERSEKNGPGKYMLPSGIAIDDDGRIYFVDQWFRKFDVFRPWDLPPDGGHAVVRRQTAVR